MGIFGSVTKNTATSDSDIDIVVEMAPNILLRAELKQELERLLGYKVDLIRYWKRMNHYLKNTLIRRHCMYEHRCRRNSQKYPIKTYLIYTEP